MGPPVSRQYWTLLSGPGTSPAILSQGVGAGVSQAFNDVCREVRCSWECDVLALFRPDWDDLVWFQFNPNALHKQCFFPKIAHCCLLPLLHVARRNEIIYVRCSEFLGKAALSKCTILIIAIFLLPRRQAGFIFHVSSKVIFPAAASSGKMVLNEPYKSLVLKYSLGKRLLSLFITWEGTILMFAS